MIRIRKDEARNKALSISDHLRPMRPGRGAKKIGPTSPPIGRKLPIHENCSAVGMKSSGESFKVIILAIDGLDQPIVVPHEIPMILATSI